MTFLEFLRENKIDYREGGSHHHVRNGYIGIDCPFCSPGMKKYRMGWSLERKMFTCWICGVKSAYETLSLLTDLSSRNLYRLVAALTGGRRVTFDKPDTETVKRQLVLPNGRSKLLKPHIRYLTARGLDAERTAALWGVEGIGPVSSRGLAWRLFIPIHHKKEIVS